MRAEVESHSAIVEMPEIMQRSRHAMHDTSFGASYQCAGREATDIVLFSGRLNVQSGFANAAVMSTAVPRCEKHYALFFRNVRIKILEFNGPKPHFRYEVRHSGGLQVNLDPFRIFNVSRNADTRLVSFFSSVRRTATAARIEHTSLG